MLTLAFLTDGHPLVTKIGWQRMAMDVKNTARTNGAGKIRKVAIITEENWVAKNGNGCEKYGKNEWCRKDKKGSDYYGRKWKARWRTFEHWMDREGRTARVCPQCGCKAVPGVYELDREGRTARVCPQC